MNNISKYKTDRILVVLLTLMAVISILTIFSATSILPEYMEGIFVKQIIWYALGVVVIYAIMTIGNRFIYDNIEYFYYFFCFLLLLLLLIGDPINNTKAWFKIPLIGSFQPSEFMKIILIMMLAKNVHLFNKNYQSPTIREEFMFILKILLITFVPAVLTFLEPDTGVVLIYLIITAVILFISGIRIRWFVIFGIIGTLLVALILGTHYYNSELFINIFGTDFFLRVDRLLDWSIKSGYQLEHGMSAIGSGGLFGHGFNNTPIYFPEPHTDFIFALFASNFGFIGSGLLFGILIFFDIRIIVIANRSKSSKDKYIVAGILGMLIYQQVQNIGMTFGVMPITGITLPFISYGGSSLISYMIIAGVLFNISNKEIRYTN